MENNPSKPVLLTVVYDQTKASMIGALLEDSGIPYFIKDKGNGTYLKVYMGYSIYGEEIYVNENNYEAAKELLDTYFNSDNSEASPEPETAEEEVTTKEDTKPAKTGIFLTKKWAARIILLLMFGLSIAVFILNHLNK
ncbi:MAG TPA: DUF2007 domain-containing protein [Mobilitalea sp.]|nr:DUF2007 domain-containing protein [Mobilitalea sp.]